MRRLHYADASVILPDSVAHALLEFASALADTETSDVVTVETVTESGERSEAELLLGPASQLYTSVADVTVEDFESPDLVDELTRRTRARRRSPGRHDDGDNSSFSTLDYW